MAGRRAASNSEAEAAEGNSGGRAEADADAIREWAEEEVLESDWVPGSNLVRSSRLEGQLRCVDAPSAPSGCHPPHSADSSCCVSTASSAPDYCSDSREDLLIKTTTNK